MIAWPRQEENGYFKKRGSNTSIKKNAYFTHGLLWLMALFLAAGLIGCTLEEEGKEKQPAVSVTEEGKSFSGEKSLEKEKAAKTDEQKPKDVAEDKKQEDPLLEKDTTQTPPVPLLWPTIRKLHLQSRRKTHPQPSLSKAQIRLRPKPHPRNRPPLPSIRHRLPLPKAKATPIWCGFLPVGQNITATPAAAT